MIFILTPSQMKSVDEYVINTLGVPSLALMEQAGRNVVEVAKFHLKSLRKKKIVVFCGKGNNGGDGFVVARLAKEYGAVVLVVLLESEKELKGDAEENFKKLEEIETLLFEKFQLLKNQRFDLIIDAMFGTSFYGSLKGEYAQAAQWINEQKKSVKIAVDIPSGLNGETGVIEGEAVKGDMTVTFSNPKLGFFRNQAKDFTGRVSVTDIGIPKEAVEKYSENIFLVEKNDIRELLPRRASNSHKHSVGKIFALAGSKGMTGAALLCSMSAMRSGAGQVILGIPDSEYPVVAKRTLEVMALGLPSTSAGSIAYNAIEEIQKRIQWADVLLIGCGLSQHAETQQLIRDIIVNCEKPVLIDADALNALVGNLDVLKKRKSSSVILTPHSGEFSRLMNVSSSEIEKDKFNLSREFAEQYNVTLVLKGAPTVIAAPSGNLFVNPTGNPGMATAGSGDVLSGIIAAMLGQKLSADAAAVCGVFIHGMAGDKAAQRNGVLSVIAGDIIKYLPNVLKDLTT